MKTLASAATVAAALLLSACGSAHHRTYPANAQSNFLNSCESSGGSIHRCGCLLNRIEQDVPFSQFVAADTAMREGEAAPAWLYHYGKMCGA